VPAPIHQPSASSEIPKAAASFFSVAVEPARLPPSIWLMKGLPTPAAAAGARSQSA